MINDELRRRLQLVSEANFGPVQNSRIGVRKRDYSFNRPSYNTREDIYQQYPEDYYYEGSNEPL